MLPLIDALVRLVVAFFMLLGSLVILACAVAFIAFLLSSFGGALLLIGFIVAIAAGMG